MSLTDSTAKQGTKQGWELTGRKVLAIVVTFFAVIFSVNFFMAYSALSTFPGVEAKNTYAASQNFDRNRAAQIALGWDVSAKVEDGMLRLDIIGPDGDPVKADITYALFGRATHTGEDQYPEFSQASLGHYMANVGELAIGNWNLRLKALSEDGTLFQQRIVIYIAGR